MLFRSFGVKNSIYKQTGIHTGTDHACPVNTPLLARLSGDIIEIGKGTQVGNYCLFKTKQGTFRYCHLTSSMPKGRYEQGSVIALSGNTGMSTGPHVHEELWKGEVNVAKLTSSNVLEYLSDSTK